MSSKKIPLNMSKIGIKKKVSTMGSYKPKSSAGVKAKSRMGSGHSGGTAINPLAMVRGGMSAEDQEILYLQKMLGIKTKKDVGKSSKLIQEFMDEGMDDFLDLMCEVNEEFLADLGSESEGLASTDSVIPTPSQQTAAKNIPKDINLSESDSDGDKYESDNDDQDVPIEMSTTNSLKMIDEEPSPPNTNKKSSKVDELGKPQLDIVSNDIQQSTQSTKYIPPHLRKKMGLSFDRAEMKSSFTQYLAQNESFTDKKNDADQNSYSYHGVMTDITQHSELYISIQSKLNKISHMNIAHIFEELVDLLTANDHPMGTFIDLFVIAIYQFCLTQTTLLSSTIQAIGVLCSGFHKVFGVKYGSLMLETFIDIIQQQYATLYVKYYTETVIKYKSKDKNSVKVDLDVIFMAPRDIKPILNLVDIVGVMYITTSTTPHFFFGFVQWLLNDITTWLATATDINAPKSTNIQNISAKLNIEELYSTTLTNPELIKQLKTKINPVLIWSIQCSTLSHIFINFGLFMRKDDNNQLKIIIKNILDDTSMYEKQWATQHLVSIIQAVRNGKQFYPTKDDSDGKNIELIDYSSLHEQIFKSVNFILANYNEDLLEKKETKGRRLNRREALKKQMADAAGQQANKTSIGQKYIGLNQLNITFSDLLRVRETGRWWITGSGYKQTQSLLQKDGTVRKDEYGNIIASNDMKDDVDDDDDDDDFLRKINTKELNAKADEFNLRTPLDRFIFATLMSSSDYLEAFRTITSKHANHANSQKSSRGSSIIILPSQYQQIAKILITVCMNEDTYNIYYSGVMMKLLNQFLDYRFPTCTAFWDAIKEIQMEYITVLKQSKMKKAVSSVIEKKMTKLKVKTMNLAKLIIDIIIQPSTIDLYALKKMAFTSLMTAVLEDMNHGDDADEDGKNDDKQIFDNITEIKAQDFAKMNDNTILFLHSFSTRLVDRIDYTANQNAANSDEAMEYVEEIIKRVIVPLQSAKSTNYVKMEQDLFKLQFTTVSKYEKVKRVERGGASVKQTNPAGTRILTCIVEALKLFVIPIATSTKNDSHLRIAKKFVKLANSDLVTHK